MKHNIELLKADIQNELAKLDLINKEVERVADKFELDDEQVSAYDRAAIGYFLHNFYNGCENIFLSIAKFFENDLAADTWHSDLLKRMKLTIQGFRPAVIDDELYVILNDFRGFRHIFRHSYVFELNWERERIVARQLGKAAKMVAQQVQDFLLRLDREKGDATLFTL